MGQRQGFGSQSSFLKETFVRVDVQNYQQAPESGREVTPKAGYIVIIAVATFVVFAGLYDPAGMSTSGRGCDTGQECVEDGTAERDNLSSEPTLLFPIFFPAKVDDEQTGGESALAPTSTPAPASPPLVDTILVSQRPPRAPGIHVLCTYLS